VTQKTLQIFTFLLAGLTLVSCLISISYNNFYQDGAWANAQWLGQDIVTLLLALPLLLISFHKGIKKEHEKWTMVYAGILLYYAYTYSFFMFVANLSILYLFHLPIFSLSVIGLFMICTKLFNQNLEYSFQKSKLKVIIITYLIMISLMILFIWLNDIFAHLSNPEHVSDTPNGEAPLIIYSLDLAIIIPLMISAAVLLYKKSTLGYILSGIILTKTSTLGFALMAMSISLYVQNLNPDIFLILLWSIIGIIGSTLSILYLKNLSVVKKV